MKKRLLMVLAGTLLFAAQAFAQQKTVTGKVTSDQGAPLAGAQVLVKGTGNGVLTNSEGVYSIRATAGQTLQFVFVGTATVERTVGTANVINVEMRTAAINMDAVEATAMGQTAAKRSLGTAQQTVKGAEIAQSQKENWANALQGRVAGLEVISNSGVPGASSQILIRGVSSISGNNQPLIVIDGLPVSNSVPHSNTLFPSLYENRTLDFTNRAADFNPEDIESLTVLKGADAASLYGIEAANGAILITTKRGRPGTNGFEYSNSFKVEHQGRMPDVQDTYGQNSLGSSTYLYWGTPYPATATKYDNVSGFFQDALTQKHNLAFSGASADSKISYRISGASQRQQGTVPTSKWNKINVTANAIAQATNWLKADVGVTYSTDSNDQPFKGLSGPLFGLLSWPDTINAANWKTPDGHRVRITTLAASSEQDNPYFAINRNWSRSKTNHTYSRGSLTVTPFSWANLKTDLGVDAYIQRIQVERDPESSWGFSAGGILDESNVLSRTFTSQTTLNLNRFSLMKDLGVTAFVGGVVYDDQSHSQGASGSLFVDPTFVSMNNTTNRQASEYLARRRRVSALGQAVFDWRNYLYVTVSGRNDWTSTIPVERNSFFYPTVKGSFVFTDAFPSLGKFMTGKVRASWAETGKDAKPYAYQQSLEAKPTQGRGYGYGFTGPNPNLKPEFAVSQEGGVELGFLHDRLGFDATVYTKETRDQIVDNLRASYGSGFILINLNGATTRVKGVELTLHAMPVQRRNFSWDAQVNFSHDKGIVTKMPENLPEYYSSDTWTVGNIRNGVKEGSSTLGLFGYWDLMNKNGDILIDPATGLPIQDSNFTQGRYDRNPDFLVGLSNTFQYKKLTLSALIDIRKGGDVVNGTKMYLVQRGLDPITLDRWTPRVVKGVLRDGLENTDHPTKNTIVVVPALNNSYYLSMHEQNFIEENINWLRLRDVTLSYSLPPRLLGAKSASIYLNATELFLLTNYSGVDPIVNSTTAATGGGGGIGFDQGNFPVPTGISLGMRIGF